MFIGFRRPGGRGPGAEAGGHSPVQEGQEGQPLIAHRRPAARKKPVLVAVLGTRWCLLHQRLLLGFVQGVLVQQVKLRSPQPQPSAPRPPTRSTATIPLPSAHWSAVSSSTESPPSSSPVACPDAPSQRPDPLSRFLGLNGSMAAGDLPGLLRATVTSAVCVFPAQAASPTSSWAR